MNMRLAAQWDLHSDRNKRRGMMDLLLAWHSPHCATSCPRMGLVNVESTNYAQQWYKL